MFKALLEAAELRSYLLGLQQKLVEQGWDDVELVKGDRTGFKLTQGHRHVLMTASGDDRNDLMWQAEDPTNIFDNAELEPSFGGTEEDLLDYSQAYFWDLEMMQAFEAKGYKVLDIKLNTTGSDYECTIVVWMAKHYAKSVTLSHRVDPGSLIDEYRYVYKEESGMSYTVPLKDLHELVKAVTNNLIPTK